MNFKQHRQIILASGSPRRKEYLERYNFEFRIITSDISEDVLDGERPMAYVTRMATEKAEAVSGQCQPNEIILAADTVVALHDRIIGKPVDKEDAIKMLEELNGANHEVITAYTILNPSENILIKNYAGTQVRFNQLSSDYIRSYVESEEPLDKAGSYSIQSTGTFLVNGIEGSYNNVVGLPIEKVIRDLIDHNFISVQEVD